MQIPYFAEQGIKSADQRAEIDDQGIKSAEQATGDEGHRGVGVAPTLTRKRRVAIFRT